MKYKVRLISLGLLVLLLFYIFIYNITVLSSYSVIGERLYDKSRRMSDYVLPNRNTTLFEPLLVCRGPALIFLLIVVSSAPKNFETRLSIRETWGNSTEFNYQMFEQIHGSFNGRFLRPNGKIWRQYIDEVNL